MTMLSTTARTRVGASRMLKHTYLSAIGDPNDLHTLSGMPYYMLQEGLAQGVFAGCLQLGNNGFATHVRRWGWNLAQATTVGGVGGYQYSQSFLERVWAPYRRLLAGKRVINLFQLCAPSILADPDIEKWFFVDLSLKQLFDEYHCRQDVGWRIARAALRREAEGYARADGVIAASRYTADGLVKDAGVPRERIHIIHPAASLDWEHYARWEASVSDRREAEEEVPRDLRLVTVVEHWHRKGLDRLLGGLALARRQGLRASLRVIGCVRESLPENLRDVSGVEWLGFVNKSPDPSRYMQLVSECDIGCLLSRAEATGLAVRDYQALGLVVFGTNAGGAADFHYPESTVEVRTTDDNEIIAQKLLSLEHDPQCVARLRRAAWRLRRQALWGPAIEQLATLWGAKAETEAGDLRERSG